MSTPLIPSQATTLARVFTMVLALAPIVLLSGQARADDVTVVTTIKPLQSIAAAVMGPEAHAPYQLVPDNASPHGYKLKPSDARALQGANLIVWVGHELETFLPKMLNSLGGEANVLEVMDLPGLTTLALRDDPAFEAHSHDHGHKDHDDHGHDHGHKDHDDHGHDHAHKDHDDHGHKDHDDHGHGHKDHAHHDDHDHKDHGHDDHHDHGHKDHDDHGHHDHGHGSDAKDAHVWLDPNNAVVIARAIADKLSAIDPDRAATYQGNAAAFVAELASLTTATTKELQGLGDARFIVFHDAYQYFEKRFGLNASGAVTLNPEVPPGAKRLREIKEKIKGANAACVFAEPQFDGKVVDVVLEGTGAKRGVLDPLGKDIPAGAEHYPALIKQMTKAFTACLG